MQESLRQKFERIKHLLGASSINGIEKLQSLWSGYGGIYRVGLEGYRVPSVIVKFIELKGSKDHPRGWATDISHERKLKSYAVETEWYEQYSALLSDDIKIPQLLFSEREEDVQLLAMEDLSESYPNLKSHCTLNEVFAVVKWFAGFHARFLGTKPEGLWSIGTYWHLDTRQDEYNAMENSPLKTNARKIEAVLNNATFQTIIHGDAKVANFCFSFYNKKVAAVDFQYVGGGVGVKDLAYFIGSCLEEEECELFEDAILDFYFEQLLSHTELVLQEKDALEKEWRQLYAVAWADFNRFLLGWMPGHKKLTQHALSKNKKALALLKS